MHVRGNSPNDAHFKDWLYQMTYNPAMQNQKIGIPSYINQTHSLDDFIYNVFPRQDLQKAIENLSLFHKSLS